uniref:Uncharacterized protein n=1 Tax=Denticeps clupeoides TaxID=299321 RepID=A0AAY4ERW3_9TELE
MTNHICLNAALTQHATNYWSCRGLLEWGGRYCCTKIKLTPDSRVFETWKNPPPPVFMEYFFFNITNPEDFLEGKAKASVTEVGPFTYREYRGKENVTFFENGTRVAAYTPKTFVFLPERSVGDPDVELITTVNIPAVAVMNKLKGSFFKATMVSVMMKNVKAGIFMTRTVNELLWGYKDPLLTKIHTQSPEVEEYFGLMYKKNGSHDGEFVYYTGEKNYLDYGKIDTWNGQRAMTFWSSDYSNMIKGTDGSVFHPFLTKEERLDIFTADLCRYLPINEVEVKGIPAYRFTPPRAVMASVKENPDNAGYCVPPGNCLGSGVLKVDVCRKGVPVVVSFPHFYLGDEQYYGSISGLSPKREHHQTYLDLNPTTGVPVRASKRAQINIILDRISGFPITRTLNGTVFPVMFLNESVVIDDASAAKLHKLLTVAKVVSYFPVLFLALGVLFLLIFLILVLRERKKMVRALFCLCFLTVLFSVLAFGVVCMEGFMSVSFHWTSI